jgi:hypothetical protein
VGLHLWGSNIDRKSSRFELDIADRVVILNDLYPSGNSLRSSALSGMLPKELMHLHF